LNGNVKHRRETRLQKQTSVDGSNKFFNSKHSLGVPTGSDMGAGRTWPGSMGAEMAACPLRGTGIGC